MRRPLLCLCACLILLAAAAAEDATEYSEPPEFGQPMLGIRMTIPSISVQEQQNLNPDEGVFVLRTFPDTAAEDMGVQPGDVVIRVNDQDIGSMMDLRKEVARQEVGNPVTVVVRRGGKNLELESYLGDWPPEIPYQDLDEAMEERYRDAQMRRYLRRAENLEGLKRLNEKLEQDLIDLRRLRDERARALGEQDAAALADMLGRQDQAAVLGALAEGKIPSLEWKFSYGCKVNRPAAVEPSCDGAATGITYGFTVDSEGL